MDSRESWLESSRGKPTRVIYSWPGVDFAPYGTLELFRGPKPVSPPLSHPSTLCRHGCKHAPIKSVGGRPPPTRFVAVWPRGKTTRTCHYCISNTTHSSSSSPTQCPRLIPMVFLWYSLVGPHSAGA